MPPKLTHHEINECHDAVLSMLDRRRTQLEGLRSADDADAVLNDLESEGELRCDDADSNLDAMVASKSLLRAIERLQTLDERLSEILHHCERCGQKNRGRRQVISARGLALYHV